MVVVGHLFRKTEKAAKSMEPTCFQVALSKIRKGNKFIALFFYNFYRRKPKVFNNLHGSGSMSFGALGNLARRRRFPTKGDQSTLGAEIFFVCVSSAQLSD
jgi:hypothetical protein